MIIIHLNETLTTSEMPNAIQGGDYPQPEKGQKVIDGKKKKKKKGTDERPIGTFTPDASGEPHDFSGDTPNSNQQFDSIQTG